MPEHISRSRYHIRHKRIMDEGAKNKVYLSRCFGAQPAHCYLQHCVC